MSITCPQCHAAMPEGAAFCPGCGRRMWVPGGESSKPTATRPAAIIPAARIPDTSAPVANSHLEPKDNVLAAFAYFTFIPAVVFVLIEPLKRNRFVRFHSFQSIFLTVATIVASLAMWLVYSVLALLPAIGFLLGWLALAVVSVGWVMLWLVLVVKALQGATFRLPLIGSLAEKV